MPAPGRRRAVGAGEQVEVAAGEVLAGVADENENVAGRGQLRRHAPVDVGDMGDGGDHQRRRDGVPLARRCRCRCC